MRACASCEAALAESRTALEAARLEASRYRKALERIIETDTHGINVLDEHGLLRPTGQDFCGRCNRNSFHVHALDCPIEAARAALSGGGEGNDR